MLSWEEILGYIILIGVFGGAVTLLLAVYKIKKAYTELSRKLELPKVEFPDGDVMIIKGDVMLRCKYKHHVTLEEAKIIVDAYKNKIHLLCPHDYSNIITLDYEENEEPKPMAQVIREEAKKKIRRKSKRKSKALARGEDEEPGNSGKATQTT